VIQREFSLRKLCLAAVGNQTGDYGPVMGGCWHDAEELVVTQIGQGKEDGRTARSPVTPEARGMAQVVKCLSAGMKP
jgi:hypothetical protein